MTSRLAIASLAVLAVYVCLLHGHTLGLLAVIAVLLAGQVGKE